MGGPTGHGVYYPRPVVTPTSILELDLQLSEPHRSHERGGPWAAQVHPEASPDQRDWEEKVWYLRKGESELGLGNPQAERERGKGGGQECCTQL